MKVLLSIKPEFAFKIFDGTKKYEFRKSIFKRKDVTKVIVYASSPVQRVIGEFEIKTILNNDTETVWDITKRFSGITKQFYDEYFANKDEAYAIQVGRVTKYDTPKLLSDYNLDFAPQSFVYL
ncbi:MAG: ASCH domain-containing protein [Flavobacteriaceae bacterium]|jgi:predicted transcriptional regulator|nr:ASCH domain-containing protein [Flavobacteriaceae bacterium]